ncbi:prolipoprotein diacylglyceryl transferase [bacterium]|jgi:phosphatidylglycerol---prolipoprotein diacylglyceryl transferase|nr:prolipoprotein diacylglyceryl transferase [bacterium]MBT6831912.1 prolipoprotein diacylglyceryl transferase [bacterium]MBT6996608.1 prolipoprotein diacylglyceryl transferase [bacterium]MBT7773028.1 prolipoprotein diacylglyceryl transferase [bacterium]
MIWTNHAIAFSIFGLDVRWYGLVYIFGFVLCLLLGYKISQKLNARATKPEWENLVFGLFFAGVLGGRFGEFLFYSPHVFFSDPLEIFKIWRGGMSIHGGLLGATAFGIWWSRKYAVNFLKLSDSIVLPLSITLIFGRLANFLNGELYGLPTASQNWGIIFPQIDGWLRHPTQLYEAFYSAILAGILFWIFRKNGFRFRGLPTTIFLAGYGIFRFLVEFFKVPDGVIGPLTTGQILCAAMVVIAFVIADRHNFWEKNVRTR